MHAQEVDDKQETEADKNAPEYELLKYIDAEDEKASKKLFKQTVNQGMPHHYGQKNW